MEVAIGMIGQDPKAKESFHLSWRGSRRVALLKGTVVLHEGNRPGGGGGGGSLTVAMAFFCWLRSVRGLRVTLWSPLWCRTHRLTRRTNNQTNIIVVAF